MSGRARIIVGKITEGNLKGKALADALARELNKDEKTATYQKEAVTKKK